MDITDESLSRASNLLSGGLRFDFLERPKAFLSKSLSRFQLARVFRILNSLENEIIFNSKFLLKLESENQIDSVQRM